MQFNLFPKEYEQKVIDECYDKIVLETRKHGEKQRNYRERLINSNIGSWVGFILGIVGGLVVCITISFTTGVIVTPLSFLLGAVADKILSVRCEYLIKEDEENYKKWEEKYKKTEEAKVRNYRETFENDAQKLSLVFLNNPITKEIVNKMRSYVERVISNANRSSYVEQVTVGIRYRVYKYKVEWVYENDVENYGFVDNRCNILKNPIEQAALSRAIARMLENFIKQNYSVDVSGTKSVIEVNISEVPNYKLGVCEYSSVEINYKASNGYYREARSW